MKKTLLIILSVIILGVIVISALEIGRTSQAPGSVGVGNEYSATSTATMTTVMNTILVNRPVTLGSIVIASSSSKTLTIWNATSTIDTASTSVAVFKANTVEGTYTFDVSLPRGLIIQTPAGFDGSYTITYRR